MRHKWGDPAAQIQRLEEELWLARMAIIDLAPSKYRDFLKSYYRCETRQDSYAWLHSAADLIIQNIEALPKETGSFLEPRVYCPLCGVGSLSYYDDGFAFPEGLRRHLTGWGRSRQCSVTAAAHQLALDHFHEKFGPAEEAERQEKETARAMRLRSEVLFRTGRGQDPVLIDDVGFSRKPRDNDSLQWAESRLRELEFEKNEEGRVLQYLRESDSYAVYADPRVEGEISFRVYRKPFSRRNQRNRSDLIPVFVIRDSWKKDIGSKLSQRIEQALEKLPQRQTRPLR